ncbi:MAG: succinate dehydrogenase, hydrophobic membrane anchor protein [Hyphomicrobiales bacterium]
MASRTSLSRARSLGAAKSGTKHFIAQRVTAIANVPLTVFFLVSMISLIGGDHADVVAFIARPSVTICFLLAILSVAFHMRLGMQVVIEDYIHGEGMKIAALLANLFFTIAIGFICVFAVLKIALTG